MEVSVEEDIDGKEAPVDGPLKHELAAKVECHDHITLGILDEKAESECDLQTDNFLLLTIYIFYQVMLICIYPSILHIHYFFYFQ